MSAPGWEDILDEDETILWQGKPRGGIDWGEVLQFQTLFGLFFTGFAVFWVAMAVEMTGSMRNEPFIFRLFPLFGLIFVAVGLNMVIGRHIWAAYVRSGTHYTLTTRAAYIATQPLGKRTLKRYGIDEMEPPTLTDTSPGAVIFGEKVTHYSSSRSLNTGRWRSGGTLRTPIGFVRIDDARRVYRLLLDARAQGKAAAGAS